MVPGRFRFNYFFGLFALGNVYIYIQTQFRQKLPEVEFKADLRVHIFIRWEIASDKVDFRAVLTASFLGFSTLSNVGTHTQTPLELKLF